MLTILGQQQPLCDKTSRRDFLMIGGLALGGLTLPTLLRAESTSPARASHKSVIMIFLSGGQARERPVHIQEIYATLYRNLGIDVNTATVTDHSGRPHFLVDNNAQPIRELA